MKKRPNPKIDLNYGEPVAICNKCSAIMCYVDCSEGTGEWCKVKEVRSLNGNPYISTPIGQTPPPYCASCDNLHNLYNYTLNE